MQWIVRGLVSLWAIFFGWTGLVGVISSATYAEMFGISGDVVAMNTIRADLSSFFIVSALAAGWAALRPDQHWLLFIPAALFGIAMIGRIIGVMMGDPFAGPISMSIMVEGGSVLLLLTAQRWMARHTDSAA